MNKASKTCDPGKCSFCQYIGDGCFLCEKYLEIVVDDWEPTDEFRMCARGETTTATMRVFTED